MTSVEYRDVVLKEILKELSTLDTFDILSAKNHKDFVKLYDEFIIHTALRDFLFAILDSYFKDFSAFIDSVRLYSTILIKGKQGLDPTHPEEWSGYGGGATIKESNNFIPSSRPKHFEEVERDKLNRLIDIFLDHTEAKLRDRYLSYVAVKAWYSTKPVGYPLQGVLVPIREAVVSEYGVFSIESPEFQEDKLVDKINSELNWDVKSQPIISLLSIIYKWILKKDQEWIVKDHLYYTNAKASVWTDSYGTLSEGYENPHLAKGRFSLR